MDVVPIVLALGLLMLAIEKVRPARAFEAVSDWWMRAVALTLVQACVASLAVLTWDTHLPEAAMWHVETGSTLVNALGGYVVITFVYYWWHRARHEITVLWRWLHQVHHSPCRIEVLTSFYKHPLEMLMNGLLSSTIVYVLLGLDPASAAVAVGLTGVAELFYHWNVRTPRWLGYFIQRPESHCVHHQRGRHTNNFSDLPLWDICFGTYENPEHCPTACGFGPDREQELDQLLLGKEGIAR